MFFGRLFFKNNSLTGGAMNNRVYIFDTTLRDGEQSPGATMNLQEKLRLAEQLEKLGVDCIEAGFPASSQGDFEAVKAIAEKVKNCQVAGLARCMEKDIERTWEAIKNANYPPYPHVFGDFSHSHAIQAPQRARRSVGYD